MIGSVCGQVRYKEGHARLVIKYIHDVRRLVHVMLLVFGGHCVALLLSAGIRVRLLPSPLLESNLEEKGQHFESADCGHHM